MTPGTSAFSASVSLSSFKLFIKDSAMMTKEEWKNDKPLKASNMHIVHEWGFLYHII